MIKVYPAYLKLFNENGLQFEMIVILLVGEHSALPENCGSVSKQKTEWAAALWGSVTARMKTSTLVSTFRKHAQLPSGAAIFNLLSVHAKGT